MRKVILQDVIDLGAMTAYNMSSGLCEKEHQ